jgi:hypothetical protein
VKTVQFVQLPKKIVQLDSYSILKPVNVKLLSVVQSVNPALIMLPQQVVIVYLVQYNYALPVKSVYLMQFLVMNVYVQDVL